MLQVNTWHNKNPPAASSRIELALQFSKIVQHCWCTGWWARDIFHNTMHSPQYPHSVWRSTKPPNPEVEPLLYWYRQYETTETRLEFDNGTSLYCDTAKVHYYLVSLFFFFLFWITDCRLDGQIMNIENQILICSYGNTLIVCTLKSRYTAQPARDYESTQDTKTIKQSAYLHTSQIEKHDAMSTSKDRHVV